MEGLKMKYFVLNPTSSDQEYAKASCEGMLAFAKAIKTSNANLAKDLERWVAATLTGLLTEGHG